MTVKHATKAGKRENFNKMQHVKAKPAMSTTKAGKREKFDKMQDVKANPATKAGKRGKIDKMHVKATQNFIGPKHWKDIPGVKEGWQ